MITALTGGIGAGKSFVAKCLKARGISVYDCDAAAKRLMTSSTTVRQQLQQLIGKKAYIGERLNKALIAEFLLAADENRLAINAIVHPAVADDFMQSGFEWIESAILFDTGFDRLLPIDYTVCVSAPLEVRICRIMKRDNISRDKAIEWINRQMSQEEVERRSDFVVQNDGLTDITGQIDQLLSKLKKTNNAEK